MADDLGDEHYLRRAIELLSDNDISAHPELKLARWAAARELPAGGYFD